MMRLVYELIKDVALKFKGDAEKFYPDLCYLFRDGNVISALDHHYNVLNECAFAAKLVSFVFYFSDTLLHNGFFSF